MSFLPADPKYQEATVMISNINEGAISLMESPGAICENAAADTAKKKPALSPFFYQSEF